MCAARSFRFGAISISCLFVGGFAAPLWADFAAPIRITGGGGRATETVLAFDIANNAYVVSVVNERLQVDLVGPNLRATLTIPGEGTGQGEPSAVTGAVGQAFIAFSQQDQDPSGIGRDIFLTHNSGGSFVPPQPISNSPLDESAPSLVLGPDGRARIAWARSLGESESTMIVYRDLAAEQSVDVAVGGYPSLWVDAAGAAHLLYTRDNDIFYINNASGAFRGEARVVGTPTEPEFDAMLAGTETGRLIVTFNSRGSLYLVTRAPGGAFAPPRLIDAPGVLDPELRVRDGGAMSIVYAKNGNLSLVHGVGDVVLDPVEVIAATPTVESKPTHRIDRCGITHVAFLQDGDIWYTNDADAIEARFSADVISGELPLHVRFQDLSVGKIQAWRWSFGDGEQSTLQNPQHTFNASGTYDVTLTVFAASRESILERRSLIAVQEPFNTLEIPDQRVVSGQQEVYFPALAGHRDPVMAFQVHAVFDSNLLTLTECTREGTASGALTPEIWECNIFERSVEVGCIFDFAQPFDGRTLLPGQSQVLVNMIFDVSEEAPAGAVTEIALINNRDVSQIFNIFTVENRSKLPVLESATVTIEPPDIAEAFFLRGDVDGSGRVDISDGIALLNFLFTGGAPPECFDAADVSDDASVDISGAIYILNFLFLGGSAPSVPFPNAGLDPTPDPWTCD